MRDVTELVTRARRGDREAMAALVAAVQDDIWRFQLSRHRSGADAEDATQETFLRMMSSLGELREPGAFRGWLYRIALNEALETGRRRAAGAKALAASTSIDVKEEETVDRSELRQAVRQAVGRLDEELRTTVELRYEHGLAYADIAQAMDCPEGTVATRLRRAHERLKQVLAGAGVMVALAAIESELSAAPRVEAPPRLSGRLSKLAREGRVGSPLVASGPRPRTVVAGFAITAMLAAVVAWRLGFASKPASAERTSPSGSVAQAAVAPLPRDGGVDAAEVSKPKSPVSVPAAAPSAHLRVRVLDAATGDPVADASVSAAWQGDSTVTMPPVTGTTDAHGLWSTDLPEGNWDVSASARGFLWSRVDRTVRGNLANVNLEEGEEEVDKLAIFQEGRLTVTAGLESSLDIRLARAGRLTCRVINAQGMPLEGVTVKVGPQSLEFRGCTFSFDEDGYLPLELRTDPEGRFSLEGFLPMGRLRLNLQHSGLVKREVDLDLAGTGERTVTMMEPRPINGIVSDALGRPLAGVRFFFRPELADSDTSLVLIAGTTDELGKYAFESGEAGVRMLVAWAPGRVPAVVDLSKTPPGRLNITLSAAEGKLSGRVTCGAEGLPAAGVRVTLSRMTFAGTEGNAELVFKGQGAWWVPGEEIRGHGLLPEDETPPSTVTGEDGRYTLEGIPPGAFVDVSRPGEGSQEFEVPASGTLDIQVGPPAK